MHRSPRKALDGRALKRKRPSVFLVDERGRILVAVTPESDDRAIVHAERAELQPAFLKAIRRMHARNARRPIERYAIVETGDFYEIYVRGTPDGTASLLVIVRPLRVRGSLDRAVRLFHLTPREAEVLHLIIQGRTTTDIAATLGIARMTVFQHVKNLFEKTGAHRRSELISVTLNV